jgi:hypothetical protein
VAQSRCDERRPRRDFDGPTGQAGAGSRAAGAVVRVWRREVGIVQRIFRWLNESAYFVSIPFIMIFLIATALKSRNSALFGATFVVVLSLGRIVAGIANLAVIPLRDGLNVRRMKKPFRRVVEPVAIIAMVVVAFTFVPWLSRGGSTEGTIAQRLESNAQDLGHEMKAKLNSTVEEAKTLELDKLGSQAREKLKSLGSVSDGVPANEVSSGEARPSAESKIGGLIKDVGTRARETIKESEDSP